MDFPTWRDLAYVMLVLTYISGTYSSRHNFVNLHIHDIDITTRLGNITGKIEQAQFAGTNRTVAMFLGIPYALPPLGERRFTRPIQFGNFSHLPTYNATFYRRHCMQPKHAYEYTRRFIQSEDCLYLNIFIPTVPDGQLFTIDNSKRYAVMIYIHGGSFSAGGADVYTGDILSTFNDVIVVTINYRLNIFGFLSTGEKKSGNYGLWDMKMAIQWVHDNIKDYGGDTTQVTLFGNSAGGAAVLYQAINPQNRGLFQRVIAQSGSCFGFWAFQSNPLSNLKLFTDRVGCHNDSVATRLACLRKLPVNKLIGYSIHSLYFNFVPSIDEDFLLEEPMTLSLRKSEAGKSAMEFFSELDLLNGVLSKDGAYSHEFHSRWMDSVHGIPISYFENMFLPLVLDRMYEGCEHSPLLKTSIIHQYTDGTAPNDTVKTRDNLIDFESDITFFIPAIHASKTHVHSKKGPIIKSNSYFYVFDYKPEFAPEPEWLDGATHVMELPYVFGFTKFLQFKLQLDYEAILPFNISETDEEFSKQIMTFWTNFAKTGEPNDSDGSPYWPPYSLETQRYLELTPNMTSRSVKHHFVVSRVAFWENVVPELTNCSSTHSTSNSCCVCTPFDLIAFGLISIVSTCIFTYSNGYT